MEDLGGLPSTGKERWGVQQPQQRPSSVWKAWGPRRGGRGMGCSRWGEGTSPRGGCFAARVVCFAAGRSPGRCGAQEPVGRRALSQRLPSPGRRKYVRARRGGAGRVHCTGQTRAGAMGATAEGPAPPGENTALRAGPGTAECWPGQRDRCTDLILRLFGQRVILATVPRGVGQAARRKDSAQLPTHPLKER